MVSSTIKWSLLLSSMRRQLIDLATSRQAKRHSQHFQHTPFAVAGATTLRNEAHSQHFQHKPFSVAGAMSRFINFVTSSEDPRQQVSPLFKCATCVRTFKLRASWTYHVRHECGKDLRCSKCNKRFKYLTHLATHNKYECGKDVRCPFCSKRFKCASSQQRHMKYDCEKNLFDQSRWMYS